MEEADDILTTIPCPYNGQGDMRHSKVFLCTNIEKGPNSYQCLEKVGGNKCPIKAFKCYKEDIVCNVCDKLVEVGAMIFLHPNCIRGKQSPNGKYCCARSACYWGDIITLKAKYQSICPKCEGFIAVGAPIKEVYCRVKIVR